MSLFDFFKEKEEKKQDDQEVKEKKVAEEEAEASEKNEKTKDAEAKGENVEKSNGSNATQEMDDVLNAMKTHHEDKDEALAQHKKVEADSKDGKEKETKNTVEEAEKKVAKTETAQKTLEINKAKDVNTNGKAKAPVQTEKPAPKVEPQRITQPIVVTYVDEKGNKIANDYRFTGNYGDVLRMDDIPTIPGFRFITKGRPKYTIKEEMQHIKIVCKKDVVSYRLIPVLEDGQKIENAPVKTLQGKPDSIIDPAKYPQVNGYSAYQSRSYKVPERNGDVKVTYGALSRTLHIVYQTDSGKTLDEVPLKGKTGEKYTIDLRANKYPGYEIAKQPDSLTNRFDPNVTRIIVRFKPVTTKVFVEFLDENGNAIYKAQTYTGKYQQSYRIKLPKIVGYELVSDSSLLNGTFDKVNTTTVLRFRKSTVSFHINFWFNAEKTQSAGKSRLVKGVVGDLFTVTIPQLDGYIPSTHLVQGRFKAENNPNFDVIYNRIHCNLTVVIDDLTGHPLKNVKPLKISGDWGQPFKLDLPQIDGYKRPDKMYEGRFKQQNQVDHVNYEPKTVSLMVSYVDAKTKKEIPSYPAQQVTGTVGLTYTISPQIIDGYRVTEMPKNAHGVFSAEPENVVFEYEPVPSELVIHSYGNAHTPLSKARVMKGYYGEPYQIKTETIPGYEFESSSVKLKGTFPSTRQDVELKYNASNVKFRLVPVNEQNKQIDDRYIMDVSGLVNERWSLLLPVIPGYDRPKRKGSDEPVARIGDYIKPQMNGKDIKLRYTAKDEAVTIHFIFKGGAHDGQHPFKDYILTGKMDDNFTADLPMREGYTPESKSITGRFTADQQDITVYYNVNYENYIIQFVDPNGNVVGSEPQARGYYGEAIEIKNLPQGYNLPEVSNTNIILDGKGTVQDDNGHYKGIYQVPVEPQDVMVNINAQTKDGMSLGVGHQLYGKYHQPQTYEVEDITGYTPVNGKTITINFDLDQHDIPVIYEPKISKITVRYFSTEGVSIKEPKVYEGHYQEEYAISAPVIPGYIPVADDVRHGTYGSQDTDMAFTYRAGSDTQSKAIIPLDDLMDGDVTEVSTASDEGRVEPVNNTSNNTQDSQTEYPNYGAEVRKPTPARLKPQMPSAEKTDQEVSLKANVNAKEPVPQPAPAPQQPVKAENFAEEQAIKPAPAKPKAVKTDTNNTANLDPRSLFKKQSR